MSAPITPTLKSVLQILQGTAAVFDRHGFSLRFGLDDFSCVNAARRFVAFPIFSRVVAFFRRVAPFRLVPPCR